MLKSLILDLIDLRAKVLKSYFNDNIYYIEYKNVPILINLIKTHTNKIEQKNDEVIFTMDDKEYRFFINHL